MTDPTPPAPQPLIIPGDSLQLPESDLLTNIGKYLSLYEHEQRKRIILVQAYNELKQELDALKAHVTFQAGPEPPEEARLVYPEDFVVGQP